MSLDGAVVAYEDILPDNGIGAYEDVFTKGCLGADDCSGMDVLEGFTQSRLQDARQLEKSEPHPRTG